MCRGVGLRAAGGQPTTVYNNFPVVAYGAKPVCSPAGTIAFTANANAPAGHRGIWIVGAGGDGPDVLIPGAYDAYDSGIHGR